LNQLLLPAKSMKFLGGLNNIILNPVLVDVIDLTKYRIATSGTSERFFTK